MVTLDEELSLLEVGEGLEGKVGGSRIVGGNLVR